MESVFGYIAVAIAVVSYGLYFRDIFAGHTKPHGFTWCIWAGLNAFIFYEQMTHGGGPGAWVTGFAAIANILIFLTAFKYGERNITRLDWVCIGLALAALGVWMFNSDAVLSVILACCVFIIGFIPTLRKSIKRAHEETAATFALNGLKFFITLFALTSFTLTTALYPIVLCVINVLFATYLFIHTTKTPTGKKRHVSRK
jgi:hypothetical protein